jgi:hypothetical protein
LAESGDVVRNRMRSFLLFWTIHIP